MDPSTLSRVIHGERLFTAEQLNAFCQVLKLEASESHILWEALSEEIFHRFGFENDYLVNPDNLVTKYRDEVQKIRRARKLGDPHLAEDWLRTSLDEIRYLIARSSGASRQNLLRTCGSLLIEKLWLLADTASGNKLIDNTLAVAKNLRKISHDLGEPGFAIKADILVANMYYLNGKFRKSIYDQKSSWNFENASHYKGLALRNNALSYAFLHQEKEFNSTKKEIFKNLSLLPLNISCVALEGVARAEGHLEHFQDSFSTLHFCKKLHREIEKKGGDYEKLRKIQIARTEIYLSSKSRRYPSKSYLKRLATEAIFLAEDRGYTRHAQKIKILSQPLI